MFTVCQTKIKRNYGTVRSQLAFVHWLRSQFLKQAVYIIHYVRSYILDNLEDEQEDAELRYSSTTHLVLLTCVLRQGFSCYTHIRTWS